MKPTALSANAFLAQLLSTPIFMRSPAFVGLMRDLVAGKSPRAAVAIEPAKRRADDGGNDDGDEVTEPELWPWEEPIYSVDAGVAIVDVRGSIVKGYDDFTCWWYGCMSTDRLQTALTEIAGRSDVLAVVLNINSPGGMALGIPETASQIQALRATKLVVAVTDTMACSAAYWLGCSAEKFFTTLSADVGCIGTYIALYDYTKMFEEWGVKLELFKRGKYKAIGLPGNPLDKDARAFLDYDCGRTNDRFLAAVRAGRGDIADETMQGQWFDGEEAVQRGLADQVVSGVPEVVSTVRAGVAAALSSAAAII